MRSKKVFKNTFPPSFTEGQTLVSKSKLSDWDAHSRYNLLKSHKP